MDERDLGLLLTGGESDRVEFKPSLSQKDKILQTICAFSNDLPNHGKPGVIFVGVDDAGSPTDVEIADDVLRALADMRTQGEIYPFPTLTVEKRILSRKEAAVVTVEPSLAPPVRFKGRVYVRVGPSNRIATPEEEIRLAERRRAKEIPFDIWPIVGSSISDLDLTYFRGIYLPRVLPEDVLAQNTRSVGEQLSSLRLASPGSDYLPTILGILVLGKDPLRYIPGAYIQFLRVEGTEMTAPIKDEKVIAGTVGQVFARLADILKAHIFVSVEIATPVEVRRYDYPFQAIWQLACNAVMHRSYQGTNAPVRITWYSDRIEISNPGGPFGRLNKDNFGKPGFTDYRNPNLAEAMKYLGLVQRFGIGIMIAQSELERNGNPPAEFDVGESWITATVRRA